MGARKKRVAAKMPQETDANAPIMAQVKANLATAPEEVTNAKPGAVIEVSAPEEMVVDTPVGEREEDVEVLEPELPQFNWLKVPPGGVDMRSLRLFKPGGESYQSLYDEFIEAGYMVKSLSVNENMVYFLFELCK